MRACSQLCGAQGALEFVATVALAPPPPSPSPPSSRAATTLGLSGPRRCGPGRCRCRGPRARFGRCTRPDLILRYGLWLPRHRGSRLIRYRLYGFI
eukprot:scaffold26482_cov62-Phaeocystis_antarctica.AAC.4